MCVATLQSYVHGERIWLCKTSEGDAEKGGNIISVTLAISIRSDIIVHIAIDC